MNSLNVLTSYQSTPAQSPAPSEPNAINLDLNLFEPKIEDFDSALVHTPPPHSLFFDNKSRRDSEFEMLDALIVAAPVVGNQLHTPDSAAKLQVQHELAVLGPILDLERGGSTGSEELFNSHPYDRGSSPLSMQSDSDRDGPSASILLSGAKHTHSSTSSSSSQRMTLDGVIMHASVPRSSNPQTVYEITDDDELLESSSPPPRAPFKQGFPSRHAKRREHHDPPPPRLSGGTSSPRASATTVYICTRCDGVQSSRPEDIRAHQELGHCNGLIEARTTAITYQSVCGRCFDLFPNAAGVEAHAIDGCINLTPALPSPRPTKAIKRKTAVLSSDAADDEGMPIHRQPVRDITDPNSVQMTRRVSFQSSVPSGSHHPEFASPSNRMDVDEPEKTDSTSPTLAGEQSDLRGAAGPSSTVDIEKSHTAVPDEDSTMDSAVLDRQTAANHASIPSTNPRTTSRPVKINRPNRRVKSFTRLAESENETETLILAAPHSTSSSTSVPEVPRTMMIEKETTTQPEQKAQEMLSPPLDIVTENLNRHSQDISRRDVVSGPSVSKSSTTPSTSQPKGFAKGGPPSLKRAFPPVDKKDMRRDTKKAKTSTLPSKPMSRRDISPPTTISMTERSKPLSSLSRPNNLLRDGQAAGPSRSNPQLASSGRRTSSSKPKRVFISDDSESDAPLAITTSSKAKGRPNIPAPSSNLLPAYTCSACCPLVSSPPDKFIYRRETDVLHHAAVISCGGAPRVVHVVPYECLKCGHRDINKRASTIHSSKTCFSDDESSVEFTKSKPRKPRSSAASVTASQKKPKSTGQQIELPAWTVQDYDLYGCTKCADANDMFNATHKYPFPRGVIRHTTATKCGGDAVVMRSRAMYVCHHCDRPFFNPGKWSEHRTKGCGKTKPEVTRHLSPSGRTRIKTKISSDSDMDISDTPMKSSPLTTPPPLLDSDPPSVKTKIRPKTAASSLKIRRPTESDDDDYNDSNFNRLTERQLLARTSGTRTSSRPPSIPAPKNALVTPKNGGESSVKAPISRGSSDGPIEDDRDEIVQRKKELAIAKNQIQPTTDGWYLQTCRCQTLVFGLSFQCVHCRKRKGDDTCRFLGIREFHDSGQRRITSTSQQVPLEFPSAWNIPVEVQHINVLQGTVAMYLLPLLRKELEHLQLPNVARRPREASVRATCDLCMTSIFSGCWMCQCCGREICGDCHETLKAYDIDVPPDHKTRVIIQKGDLNRRLYHCELRFRHFTRDFVPVTRFDAAQLSDIINRMELAAVAAPLKQSLILDDPPAIPAYTSVRPDDPSQAPSLEMKTFVYDSLTEDIFRPLWSSGEPLVVTGLLPKFTIGWTPQYFIDTYGDAPCFVVDCETEETKETHVGTFFEQFGVYEGRTNSLKLKDWPPASDFKTEFPELFADFSNAVPVPSYTRRDGILNIASHFPNNAIAPDIGPKMYNAFEASEGPGGKGSTRLHMDMADAVNIMLYAAKRQDGSDGYAAWNIFRAEDADLIRQFLQEEFPDDPPTNLDPIHSQVHFLDISLRHRLWQKKGVLSWRIHQRPGEAVFIPAGCAHQVCNIGDCIKVAVDYVSPQNVKRCERLTAEFRKQNQAEAWKEDVLQLRTMMWYAWLCCDHLKNTLPA